MTVSASALPRAGWRDVANRLGAVVREPQIAVGAVDHRPRFVTPPVNYVITAACSSPGTSIATVRVNADNITIFKPLPVIWNPRVSP